MIQIKDLDFKQHPVDPTGTQARVDFANGYGVSVVTGDFAYGDGAAPYEVAVFLDGHITYDTPITDDVIGHQDEAGVNEILEQIQALPNA